MKNGDRVDFLYVSATKNEVIHVVGIVAESSKSTQQEGLITIRLDTPRDGKPYITCRLERIQPIALAS